MEQRALGRIKAALGKSQPAVDWQLLPNGAGVCGEVAGRLPRHRVRVWLTAQNGGHIRVAIECPAFSCSLKCDVEGQAHQAIRRLTAAFETAVGAS